MKSNRSNELLGVVRQLAADVDGFQEVRGPGLGNRATNDLMRKLGEKAVELFGPDVAERKICGDNSLAVDFYFKEEATIVEVALGLPNPCSEFEKDVLKAIMAKANGVKVDRLFFISRPGAIKKCNQPGRQDVIDWLGLSHGIQVEVHELKGDPRQRRRSKARPPE